MKRNNSNADEEIYLSSAAAKVVHDKQIANTLGYKVVLLWLQQQYALTSYITNTRLCIENDVQDVWTKLIELKPHQNLDVVSCHPYYLHHVMSMISV